MHYAHSLDKQEKQLWHPLREHLAAVARLAGARGAKFGSHKAAALGGLLHDLGKYTAAFQKRLEGANIKVDHSTAGAREISSLGATGDDRLIAEIIAHGIAGHHAGLPDSHGDVSLDARLKKDLEPLDPVWREEIAPEFAGLMPPGFRWEREKLAYQLAFFGRMLFSCLVDADFRDTELFYKNAAGQTVERDWPFLPDIVDDLIVRFEHYMLEKRAEVVRAGVQASPVNLLREEVLAHVRARSAAERGLFTLTVPTGGGKTLASLAFALTHAKRHCLERIVYAISFTSVIDQTASIFRNVLGDGVVLEHHSSIDEEHMKEWWGRDKLRLAMEDWVAPIVVTTNVQLFESLHSNRPSRCRRLHNLSNAVIVLDEAQTIPLPLLLPCIATLNELSHNYGSSIVICTATQPAIGKPQTGEQEGLKRGLELGRDRELAPDPARLHASLRRVRLKHRGIMPDEEILSELKATPQGLVIVNSRAHALSLYRAAVASGLEGAIHLTTRQYAAHRQRILADVRGRLKANAACRVIATSLVEAGVDLDFPRVWRAEAGLDQIAQAAGRCNREGARPIDSSIVSVFRSAEHKPPQEIRLLAEDMGRMAAKHADLLSPEAMRDYFGEVYWRHGERLDREKILDAFRLSNRQASFDYREVAERFRMIESGLMPIVIPVEEGARETLEALRSDNLPSGIAARRLQPFVVQVPPKARLRLLTNGHARFVFAKREEDLGDQFAELVSPTLYRKEIGLLWEDAEYLGLENSII